MIAMIIIAKFVIEIQTVSLFALAATRFALNAQTYVPTVTPASIVLICAV